MDTVWVWRGLLFWFNPTFSNHLKERWYHYRYCQAKAPVWSPQRYLDRWQKDLEKMLAKRPGDNVHSHAFYTLAEIMKDRTRSGTVITFLGNNDLINGMDDLVRELKQYQLEENPDAPEIITEPNDSTASIQEEPVLPPPHPEPDIIVTRAYVIGADIYHELYRTPKEYEELKASRPKYVEFLKQQFRVEKLAGRIYDLRNFDFRPILKEKTATRRGQLRPQLEQIAQNPSVFGEKVSRYVEDLLKKYFDTHSPE